MAIILTLNIELISYQNRISNKRFEYNLHNHMFKLYIVNKTSNIEPHKLEILPLHVKLNYTIIFLIKTTKESKKQ